MLYLKARRGSLAQGSGAGDVHLGPAIQRQSRTLGIPNLIEGHPLYNFYHITDLFLCEDGPICTLYQTSPQIGTSLINQASHLHTYKMKSGMQKVIATLLRPPTAPGVTVEITCIDSDILTSVMSKDLQKIFKVSPAGQCPSQCGLRVQMYADDQRALSTNDHFLSGSEGILLQAAKSLQREPEQQVKFRGYIWIKYVPQERTSWRAKREFIAVNRLTLERAVKEKAVQATLGAGHRWKSKVVPGRNTAARNTEANQAAHHRN